MRFCRQSCKQADLRDRRAQARVDLVDALAELRGVEARVETALRILGLNPEGTTRKENRP